MPSTHVNSDVVDQDKHLGDLDSIIAITCALGFGAIILSIGNRFDKEE